ncbi:sugar ABC transporter substrate-binding protein [Butyricicoccus sp.]|uniref:sugar ABC transporter substrate-binding protein n=1 Tax=Butyricicoccus sp. TaxID=2049021 RepID=UPI003F1574D6
MKMKRTVAAAMAAVMCAGLLAGCGSGSSDSGSAASNSSNLKEVNYILATRSEFQSALSAAMVAAGEEMGYKVVIQNGDSDVAKQIQYIETCRNAGQEAVLCQPVDADSTQSLIDAAGDMAIVFVNCQPTNLDELKADNVAYVGSNEDTAGYFQGEYLAEYFKAKGKTDVSYIMLQGQLGYVATTKRTQSAIKGMTDNGINAKAATADLVADFDRPTAQEMIAPILVSGVEYDCIIANNDAMALGAVEACKAANIDPAEIPICGIDCTADGAQAVANGDMAMTVFQNPVGQGSAAIQAAINIVEGKALNENTGYELDDSGEAYSDSIIWVPFEPVTKDNVADYM